MIGIGSQVEHADFGIGKVLAVLGETATVEFFGEAIDVVLNELAAREPAQAASPPARTNVVRMMPDALPIFFGGRMPYEGQSRVMPEIVRGSCSNGTGWPPAFAGAG